MIVIVVKGRPVSINSSSRNRDKWKNQVAAKAKVLYAVPSSDDNLEVKITFFYKAVPDFDTDNMSKPIVDALKGIAFCDDNQVKKHSVGMVDLNRSFNITNPDPTVDAAIADGTDFVCITVRKVDTEVVNI